MSKHPEVLWAQRSSESVKEKVSTHPSTFKYTHSPSIRFDTVSYVASNPSQLECSIRDSQPSRYRRIVPPV
jgi:hypothetical protein